MDLILRRNKLGSRKAETVMAIFFYVQVKSMHNDLFAVFSVDFLLIQLQTEQ